MDEPIWYAYTWCRVEVCPLLHQSFFGKKQGHYVYVVYDGEGYCLYVGQTRTSILSRFQEHINKASALGERLVKDDKKGHELRADIYAIIGNLDAAERYFIHLEQPLLNETRYESYISSVSTPAYFPDLTVISIPEPRWKQHIDLDNMLASIYAKAFRDPNHPDLRCIPENKSL